MILRVIEGGRSATSADVESWPSRDDVEREAGLRLTAIDHDRWRRREIATGITMPREIKYLAMQIGFTAKAIASLAVIPQDFRSDIYWPGSMGDADAPPRAVKTAP